MWKTKVAKNIHICKTNVTSECPNYLLFADDTTVDIHEFPHIYAQLNAYMDSADFYSLLIQWAKVMVSVRKTAKK